MKSQYLIRRLQYLYTTERFFVYVCGGLGFYVVLVYPIQHTILLLYGLAIVGYLLFQGQRYWRLKLGRVLGKPVQEVAQLAFFHQAKRINQWLIGVMPLVLGCQLQLLGWHSPAPTQFGLAVLANVFGILEYVNYYHWQLMIDTVADVRYLRRHQKLKAASLAKDLAEFARTN